MLVAAPMFVEAGRPLVWPTVRQNDGTASARPVLLMKDSIERLQPTAEVFQLGEPLSAFTAVRVAHDHHELGRFVVVPRFETEGFVLTIKKPEHAF
jgi:hypothetical protein